MRAGGAESIACSKAGRRPTGRQGNEAAEDSKRGMGTSGADLHAGGVGEDLRSGDTVATAIGGECVRGAARGCEVLGEPGALGATGFVASTSKKGFGT